MIVEHTFHRTWCGHSISARISFCLMAVVRFFGLSHECMTNTKELHFPSLSERILLHYLGDCVVKVSGFFANFRVHKSNLFAHRVHGSDRSLSDLDIMHCFRSSLCYVEYMLLEIPKINEYLEHLLIVDT